ncbi:MAG TPA: DUF1090 family protein [Herbaspirillum sp.]|jgi:hypothetical protein
MKMPARLLPLAVLVFAAMQTPAALAQTQLTGCAAKRDSITQQIQQSDGNPQRRISLEKALDEVNAHCTDSKLTRQRNQKVINAQVKVNETGRALHKAEEQHRSEKKVQKLRDKYEAAKKKLADAEAELKS